MKNYTVYKTIHHDSGKFELSAIKFEGKWEKDIMLTWDPSTNEGEFWDNPDWVIKTYKHLKKKRWSSKIKEFKDQCKLYGLDFEEARADFIKMMKEAKKEGMWS